MAHWLAMTTQGNMALPFSMTVQRNVVQPFGMTPGLVIASGSEAISAGWKEKI
jgi:hypothetical protein